MKVFNVLKRVLNGNRNRNTSSSIFSYSILRTSLYEELQKNGWCDIVDDKPDNLVKYVKVNIRKSR